MPPLTHFLCIPLLPARSSSSANALTQISRSLQEFAAGLDEHAKPAGGSGGEASPGWLEGAVRPVGTLHLTLGVMSLHDDTDGGNSAAAGGSTAMLSAARRLLTTVPLSTLTFPLRVSLRSVKAMQSPTKSTVLYTHPEDDTGRLRPLCEYLRGKFVDAGLIQPEDRPLKLHATLVNTIYTTGKRKGGRKKRIFINAEDVIERFADFEFAQLQLDRVAICKMGAKKVRDEAGVVVNQEYEVVEERVLDLEQTHDE